MKNSTFAIVAIYVLAGIFLANCKKNDNPITQSGNSVTLKSGDCAIMTDYNLTFCIDSIKPYVCSCYEDCSWEGSVDAVLRVTEADSTEHAVTLTLSMSMYNPGLSNEVKIGNKIIRFENINAVQCEHKNKPEKYKVTLLVIE